MEAKRGSGGISEKTGGWEGYLVLGMVCMAVVASLSSVIWFVKSYRSTSAAGCKLREDHRDYGSEGSASAPSSLSSFEESLRSGSAGSGVDLDGRLPHNLDTRSELEVELDFEFSEERNGGGGLCGQNPKGASAFHLQLDSIWNQHSSASQA